MKSFAHWVHQLAIVHLLFTIFSCSTQKSDQPSKQIIKDLGLKRGGVVSCGPPSGEFGSVVFETSCGTQVQKDFNIALSILHSFEYDEAEKIFAKIIDAEPACALAYWGVAMCNYHPLWAPPNREDLIKGARAIAIGKSIKQKTNKERDYINALDAFYTNWQHDDHLTRSLRYKEAMGKIYNAYPNDKEAAVFYALALTATADPTDKSFSNQHKAYQILTAMYPGQPDHPGIVHYTIHSYDYPGLAKLALPAAKKYAAIAPASAHAQHMPSHIFTRLGLWDESIKSNIDAATSARCYAEAIGNNAHWDEELHMIDYLTYAYLQKGDNKLAGDQCDYLKTIKDVKPYNFKVAYAFASVPARYVLENKLWTDAANLTSHITPDKWKAFPWQLAILHFARAMGAAHIGNVSDARNELKIMNVLYDTLLHQKDNYKANQVMIQIETAEAWLSLKEGNKAAALQLMEAAATSEDRTEKHPVTPGEVLPARELLGDMLLKLQRPAEALAAYEATLLKSPNRFNALLGAGQAAEALGNKSRATKYYKELLLLAKDAKPERMEVKQARLFLAQNQNALQGSPAGVTSHEFTLKNATKFLKESLVAMWRVLQ